MNTEATFEGGAAKGYRVRLDGESIGRVQDVADWHDAPSAHVWVATRAGIRLPGTFATRQAAAAALVEKRNARRGAA